MTKSTLHFLFFILLFGGVFSCTDDDSQDKVDYSHGTLVLHEGLFQTGTGTVSFVGDTGSVTNKIFELENNGQILGNILQSATVVGDLAYLVVNNANKIVIVNKNSFKYEGEITGLKQPQYAYVKGNRLYVSQWGIGGDGSGVVIVNLSSKAIEKTILIPGGPQHMIAFNNELFIGLSGGFLKDNQIVELDLNADTILRSQTVDDVPNQMQIVDGKIWLLCSGYYDFVNPDQSSKGGIYVYQNSIWTKKLELEQGGKSLEADAINRELYTVGSLGLVKYSIDNNSITQLMPGYFYGLGFNAETQKIWVADAKNFSSPGDVLVLNRQGDLLDTHQVDIIPNGFIFN